MNWKDQLVEFECKKQWDSAIEFMQKIIIENPNSLDAYVSMNYLLMNLLVEEDYDESRRNNYEALIKQYFQESYVKFTTNPEYLFFTAMTAYMSEWYFGIEIDDAKAMLYKAMLLDPKNILYKWSFYGSLDIEGDAQEKILALPYAQIILEENSPIKENLKSKGALGEYLIEIMCYWSRKVVA
jgi:hypothetical protein